MNAVRFAERSKVARHESVHASASIFLGTVPDEIRVIPVAHDQSGYIQGYCEGSMKHSANAVVIACGIIDGHGISDGQGEGDLHELERLVPDPDRRAEALDIAAQVMAHPEFVRVRNALWRHLQFIDRMLSDEIAKIATAAAGRPLVT